MKRTRLLSVGVAVAAAGGLGGALLVGMGPADAASGATLTVAKKGGQYTSIQAAVNAVPNNSATRYTIRVGAGTYNEAVTIPATKTHLTLLGATGNPNDVVIAAAHASQDRAPGGGTYGTLGSATVHVLANDFTAEYLTFSNTFDRRAYPSYSGTQAVAVAMQGDRQTYLHDVFAGHQDTLLSWASNPSATTRQYVADSVVRGDVDFIFGNGTLVVDRSTVEVLNDGVYAGGYLTAPATLSSHPYGILLTGCTVTSSLKPGTVGLGRNWQAFNGASGQVVIRNTVLPAAINTARPWTAIPPGPNFASGRYGEYGNTGPGATITSARPQLSSSRAAQDTAQRYLAGSDGWNPVLP